MTPDPNTRMGRMLAAGSATITITSQKSGQHITVRIDCCAKDGLRWSRVPFAEASHLFLNQEPDGNRIGTFYPRNDGWRDAAGQYDDALRWAAKACLQAACGQEHPQARFQEHNFCGKCRRELTDPESIDRGIGPECYGKLTGSKPYRSRKGRVTVEVKRESPVEAHGPEHFGAHNGDHSPPPTEADNPGNGWRAPDTRSPGEREFGDWLTSEFPGPKAAAR